MKSVFISYSSKETDKAENVRNILETNGISCWMAPRDIAAGSNYTKAIPAAIQSCKIFLLIFSQNAQNSPFVPKELECAVTNGKIIIPFMLENCPINEDFNFLLSGSHRFLAFQQKTDIFEKLIREIRMFLDPTDPKPDPKPGPESESTTKPKEEDIRRKKRKKILICVLLIVLYIGGFLLIKTFINWLDEDEQRHAAEQAERIACNYAELFLWDARLIRTTLLDAIQSARTELQQCTDENPLVPDFTIRQYRDSLYNVIIFPTLISEHDAKYIYSSDFEPEFAISIHNLTIRYLEEGKLCLEDIDNLLRINTILTAPEKYALLDYLEQYISLFAQIIELQTNQFLLPVSDPERLEELFSNVEEVVEQRPLLRDVWSDDPEYLHHRCEEVDDQLRQLGALLQNDAALLETLALQTAASEN